MQVSGAGEGTDGRVAHLPVLLISLRSAPLARAARPPPCPPGWSWRTQQRKIATQQARGSARGPQQARPSTKVLSPLQRQIVPVMLSCPSRAAPTPSSLSTEQARRCCLSSQVNSMSSVRSPQILQRAHQPHDKYTSSLRHSHSLLCAEGYFLTSLTQ
jgi:hypothetical protein